MNGIKVFKIALNLVLDITIQSAKIDQKTGRRIIAITIFSKVVKVKKVATYIIQRYATANPPKSDRLILKNPSSLLLSFFKIFKLMIIPF
ncbi:MAG: hypothetical protein HWD90_12785 [Campylobacteraceae bacterium]|nr:hypothetical protein [Campylobacteraceae bacterium]